MKRRVCLMLFVLLECIAVSFGMTGCSDNNSEGSSQIISIAENGTATSIAISYKQGIDRYIFYANNLDLTGTMTNYSNKSPVYYTRNGMQVVIVEKSKANFKLTKEDILNYFNDALKLEPQLLINYLVNQIILYDDKMQIYFNSPSISTNNTTKIPFKTKTYKLPHIIQNKPQLEMIDILVEFYI